MMCKVLSIILVLPLLSWAQAPDISIGLANKHSYFVNQKANEKAWVNYYQVSYAHPLNKAFSLTGHLSFAQDASEEVLFGVDGKGEPLHEANNIFSVGVLDIALRWNVLNLLHHQLGLYAGPSIKRQNIMSGLVSYTGFLYTDQESVYDPFTLHRLEPRAERDSYEVGTDSRWIGAAYLAAEYLFYPIEQLGIGYTFRVRAQPWFLFEDVSIGPVLRYRWADTEANQKPVNGALAMQVLPTYASSTERLVTQVRTQYHYTLAERWGVGGSIAYLQGSRFSDDYTPALINDYYQYHSTAVAITATHRLLAHDKHQISVIAGPAYYWGARSYAENFFNAVNDETDEFYYNPEVKEGDREYYGNLLMVEVKRNQGWGGNLQLAYTYQLTPQVGLGGVIDYQRYTDGESLAGAGFGLHVQL